MDIEILDDADAVAKRAAAFVATAARQSAGARNRFVLAVSGGRTPWKMLRILAGADVPWENVRVAQVDERVAPEGHLDRNLAHLRQSLLSRSPLLPQHIYPMPVGERDLAAAASNYARLLEDLAGSPPVFDLIHLGLGPDGHTASLVPGDPVLDVEDVDVSVTSPYQGRQRMTLTYPALDRARQLLWLVTGADKSEMLPRLRDGDDSIPAGRVARENALVLADRSAAKRLQSQESE